MKAAILWTFVFLCLAIVTVQGHHHKRIRSHTLLVDTDLPKSGTLDQEEPPIDVHPPQTEMPPEEVEPPVEENPPEEVPDENPPEEVPDENPPEEAPDENPPEETPDENPPDDNELLCGILPYNATIEVCCGSKIGSISEKDTFCLQAISILMPLDAPDAENISGIVRYQEIGDNTIKIFMVVKNLDKDTIYEATLREYGDTSSSDGVALGGVLRSTNLCENGTDIDECEDEYGELGDLVIVNEVFSATTFKSDLSLLRGELSIVGKGVAVHSVNDDNTDTLLLQGSVNLCGKHCAEMYPIDEAIISYSNWTWYKPMFKESES